MAMRSHGVWSRRGIGNGLTPSVYVVIRLRAVARYVETGKRKVPTLQEKYKRKVTGRRQKYKPCTRGLWLVCCRCYY